MAIHPTFQGIEVTVCVNGKALKEHAAENEEIQHFSSDVRQHALLRLAFLTHHAQKSRFTEDIFSEAMIQ
jgi:hypothetical protein